MKSCSQVTLLQTLVKNRAVSALLSAAGAPDPPQLMDQTQGDMDWRFWGVLASLIVMSGRQLRQDVLALGAWIFPAAAIAPKAVPEVAINDVCTASSTLLSSSADATSMSGPEVPDAGASSAAAAAPPTVPIFVSRHGDRYHYRQECSGLRLANPLGIESKTLCKTCDAARRR
jgi:hypothetical protein